MVADRSALARETQTLAGHAYHPEQLKALSLSPGQQLTPVANAIRSSSVTRSAVVNGNGVRLACRTWSRCSRSHSSHVSRSDEVSSRKPSDGPSVVRMTREKRRCRRRCKHSQTRCCLRREEKDAFISSHTWSDHRSASSRAE
eukprot:3941794-Rhodomonas_salina.1